MGLYDCICIESGLILRGDTRVIPIEEITTNQFLACAAPMLGTYDRGGTIDEPKRLDANAQTFLEFAKKKLTFEDPTLKRNKMLLNDVLGEIRADGSNATYDARRITFALVDDAVYRAIVALVSTSSEHAWRRIAQVALGTAIDPPLPERRKGKPKKPPKLEPTTKKLLEKVASKPSDRAAQSVLVDHLLEQDDPRGKLLAILPKVKEASLEDLLAAIPLGPTAAGAIYKKVDAAKKKSIRTHLADLACFLAWGTKLMPAFGEGQFTGLDKRRHEDGSVAPYIEHAKKKYAGIPALTKIALAKEKDWQRFDEENADDDDDDY